MNELDIEMDKYFTKCRYDWFIGFWVWGIKWSEDFVHVHCRNMLLIFFYGSSGFFHCSFQNNTNYLWYRQFWSWSFNSGVIKSARVNEYVQRKIQYVLKWINGMFSKNDIFWLSTSDFETCPDRKILDRLFH